MDADPVTQLAEAVAREDHPVVRKLSAALLEALPNDPDYLRCWALSSLRLGHTQELLQGMFRQPPTVPSLQPLYAYALYSAQQYAACYDYLRHLRQPPELSLLEAQCCFQLQHYQHSARLMAQLEARVSAPEDREMYRVNLVAAQLFDPAKDVLGQVSPLQCKELNHNCALVLAELGEYPLACELIAKFSKAADNPDDKASALLLHDYVEWKQGRLTRPPDYSHLLEVVEELNVAAMLNSNRLALQESSTPEQASEQTNEHLKLLEELNQPQYKLTLHQWATLQLNKAILLLRKNRVADAAKALKELERKADLRSDSASRERNASQGSEAHSRLPSTEAHSHLPSTSVLRSVAYLKAKFEVAHRSQAPRAALLEIAEEADKSDPKLGCAMKACLYADGSLDLYSGFKEARDPLLKRYLLALMMRKPDEVPQELLTELLPLTNDPTLLESMLDLSEAQHNNALQTEVLSKLLALNPRHAKAKVHKAKLLLAEGQTSKAEELLSTLEVFPEITDVAFLQFLEKNIHVSKSEEPALEKKKQRRRAKRKRQRLPRHMERYIENFQPDPERWLPKWQRKGYRKKGRKTHTKTQGLATVDKAETKNTYTSASSTATKEVTKDKAKRKKA